MKLAATARRSIGSPIANQRMGTCKRNLDMPAGAIGLWYIDRYTNTTRPVIPNAVSTVPVSSSLYAAPRRMFQKADVWGSTNCTVTDSNATAPDGSNDATTVVGTGNWFLRSLGSGTIAGATYTLAVNVKRNTGSDQLFCLFRANTATKSSQFTATSSWQRFSWTFTTTAVGIGTIGICSIDGATAANLQICDMELFAGSSDLGPQTLAGHLYPGTSGFDTRPTYSAGELNLASTGCGLIQFPSAQTLGAFTVQACFKKTTSSTAICALLSDVQAFANFTVAAENANVPYAQVSSATPVTPGQQVGLWSAVNQGYHIVTHVSDGTNYSVWVDDARVLHGASAAASVNVKDLWVNFYSSSAFTGKSSLAGVLGLWNRALTIPEIVRSVDVQKDIAARAGVSVVKAPRVLYVEGDSITNQFVTCYPYVFGANANPSLFGVNYGVTGSNLINLNSRLPNLLQLLAPNKTNRKFIVSVLEGRNDCNTSYSGPGGSGVAGWLADYATYLDQIRATGALVAIGTLLPSTASGFNAARNTANTTLLTWIGVHCDVIFDFAADPTMGPDAAASNVSLYSDGTHPTASAQSTYLEPIYRAAINGM